MITLNTLKVGETGRVLRISDTALSYRAKLLSMGMTPGTDFTIIRHAPMGDPIEIEVRGYRLSLRKAESEVLEVEVSR